MEATPRVGRTCAGRHRERIGSNRRSDGGPPLPGGCHGYARTLGHRAEGGSSRRSAPTRVPVRGDGAEEEDSGEVRRLGRIGLGSSAEQTGQVTEAIRAAERRRLTARVRYLAMSSTKEFRHAGRSTSVGAASADCAQGGHRHKTKSRGLRPGLGLGLKPSTPDTYQYVYGPDRVRTGDPLLAKQVLSQLSYRPWRTRAEKPRLALRPCAPI